MKLHLDLGFTVTAAVVVSLAASAFVVRVVWSALRRRGTKRPTP